MTEGKIKDPYVDEKTALNLNTVSEQYLDVVDCDGYLA